MKIAPDEKRLDCLREFSEGNMRRSQQQNVPDPYSQQLKENINKVIKTANNLLLRKKKMRILSYLDKGT